MAAEIPSTGAAANATSVQPACAMEEYASNRFTLFCTSAPRLPKVMESAAASQINQIVPGTLIRKTMRNKTANAAAFGAVDINPTIGAGAPSYTSGVQTWNGAAATLNPRPTNMKATATNASNGIRVVCNALPI